MDISNRGVSLPFMLSFFRLRAFRSPTITPSFFTSNSQSAGTYLHLLLASMKGTVANSMQIITDRVYWTTLTIEGCEGVLGNQLHAGWRFLSYQGYYILMSGLFEI